MNFLEYPIDVALTLFSNPGVYLVILMLVAVRFVQAPSEHIKTAKRILWCALAFLFIFAAISPSNTYKHEPHNKEDAQRLLEQDKQQDYEQARKVEILDRALPIDKMSEEEFGDKVDWRNRPSRGE